MWVCTIISKSIYVAQLPRVQVKTLEKKYIEHVVEGDGIVVAGGEQAVNVLPGLRVSNIKVQEGDLVEKGDLLFGIDLEDLSDMISDKEAELTKQRMHLSDTQFNQILESQKRKYRFSGHRRIMRVQTRKRLQQLNVHKRRCQRLKRN